MTKYITKLKNERPEILTDKEITEYLHYFTKEEIDYMVELHYDERNR